MPMATTRFVVMPNGKRVQPRSMSAERRLVAQGGQLVIDEVAPCPTGDETEAILLVDAIRQFRRPPTSKP